MGGVMTTPELKEEIIKELDNIPEASLKDVLELIIKIQQKHYIDVTKLDEYVDAIISENRGLFKRLAE
ncbi:hypothetical protein IDJ77_20985 [Mucilaginibacter sp. ZT4R22]|uniref:Uncharacterized protein n=1 Tax=Mucilaginibacter pankratovii TaxID=2772110 RepID=A0ABR7WVI6_9SPHI|nr:hypothetical protein [Mucilaginibacter pankratovii]MBD1366301.1 hypothetical protein [Mucilaginibacter pankratovii]